VAASIASPLEHISGTARYVNPPTAECSQPVDARPRDVGVRILAGREPEVRGTRGQDRRRRSSQSLAGLGHSGAVPSPCAPIGGRRAPQLLCVKDWPGRAEASGAAGRSSARRRAGSTQSCRALSGPDRCPWCRPAAVRGSRRGLTAAWHRPTEMCPPEIRFVASSTKGRVQMIVIGADTHGQSRPA
jgi:hypothetical protein